jgi:epoxyqueuosine reductase QueG
MKPLSDHLKQFAAAAGADLCGIASVDRFNDAPAGFHPHDLWPAAKSVAVLAIGFPEAPFHAQTMVPYTAVNDRLLDQMTGLLCKVALEMERKYTAMALPMPGEPYEYWDAKKMEGRGNLSLKHAAWLAGLGVMGRNTLLVTPQLGNRLVLGALLLDVGLESDPMIDVDPCPADCRLCIEGCPVQAIDGRSVIQKRCRRHSGSVTEKGYALYTCFHCRSVCPNARGLTPTLGFSGGAPA